MIVEIKSPTEIKLTPETLLEDSIVRGGEWSAKVEQPKPLELNRLGIVLQKKADGSA